MIVSGTGLIGVVIWWAGRVARKPVGTRARSATTRCFRTKLRTAQTFRVTTTCRISKICAGPRMWILGITLSPTMWPIVRVRANSSGPTPLQRRSRCRRRRPPPPQRRRLRKVQAPRFQSRLASPRRCWSPQPLGDGGTRTGERRGTNPRQIGFRRAAMPDHQNLAFTGSWKSAFLVGDNGKSNGLETGRNCYYTGRCRCRHTARGRRNQTHSCRIRPCVRSIWADACHWCLDLVSTQRCAASEGPW